MLVDVFFFLNIGTLSPEGALPCATYFRGGTQHTNINIKIYTYIYIFNGLMLICSAGN